ncbi:MAG: HD domain-containing protein [Christensenellales bacterium]|jgi:hypothetical protein
MYNIDRKQPEHFKRLPCIKKMVDSEQSNGLLEKWMKAAEQAQKILDSKDAVQKTFYTPHDFSNHCFNVYINLDTILQAGGYDYLQENNVLCDSLFLINVAILFHDISMNVFTVDEDRDTHSEDAVEQFRGGDINSLKHFGVTNEQADIICTLIKAHSDIKNKGKVITSTLKDFRSQSIGPRKKIDVAFLAGLIRLADELDITKHRAGGITVDEAIAHSRNAKKHKDIIRSLEHWRKLELFESVEYKKGADGANEIRLYLDASCFAKIIENPSKLEEWEEGVRQVNKKIQDCWNEIRKEVGSFANVIKARIQLDASRIGNTCNRDGNRLHYLDAREFWFYHKLLPFMINDWLKEDYPDIYKTCIQPRTDKSTRVAAIVLHNSSIQVSDKLYDKQVCRNWKDDDLITQLGNEKGKELWPGKKFYLKEIADDRIQVGLCTYYNILGTADREILWFIRKFDNNLFYKPLTFSDFSSNEYIQNLICKIKAVLNNDYTRFCAGMGISTLVIFNHKGEYYYLIMRGSKAKATGNNDQHVIPSSMFEPILEIPCSVDLSINLQILREFGEEVLGLEPLENVKDYDVLEKTFNSNKLLKQMFSSVKDTIYKEINQTEIDNSVFWLKQTGLVLDIVHLRVAVTNVMYIKKEGALDNILSDELLTNCKEVDKSVPMYKLDDEEKYIKLIQEKRFVPEGLAALISGRKAAMEYILAEAKTKNE